MTRATLDRRTFLIGAGLVPVAARAAGAQDGVMKFRDLYGVGGELSAAASARVGGPIAVDGYMAPPLKALSRFFVLTKLPMSYCPFCETEAEWPENIVVVYTREVVEAVSFNALIVVTGRLDVGGWKDEETGFWSKVRILDAGFRRA